MAELVTLRRDQLRHGLRRAIGEVFYPRIPAADDEGQARIDRAVDRVLAELTSSGEGGEREGLFE